MFAKAEILLRVEGHLSYRETSTSALRVKYELRNDLLTDLFFIFFYFGPSSIQTGHSLLL